MTVPLEGMVAKDVEAGVCTIPADFAGAGVGDRDAMKRRLVRDIVGSYGREGDQPVQEPQHRARYSSMLIF